MLNSPNFVQSLLQDKAACKQQGQKGVVKYLQNSGWYPEMANLPVNLAAIYDRAECNRLDESILWLVLFSQRNSERASVRKWESSEISFIPSLCLKIYGLVTSFLSLLR